MNRKYPVYDFAVGSGQEYPDTEATICDDCGQFRTPLTDDDKQQLTGLMETMEMNLLPGRLCRACCVSLMRLLTCLVESGASSEDRDSNAWLERMWKG